MSETGKRKRASKTEKKTESPQALPLPTEPLLGFNDLGLRPELLQAVLEAGYSSPTPIQQQAIPSRSRDVT
jgi:Superfamily II DNA and RNA helicases